MSDVTDFPRSHVVATRVGEGYDLGVSISDDLARNLIDGSWHAPQALLNAIIEELTDAGA